MVRHHREYNGSSLSRETMRQFVVKSPPVSPPLSPSSGDITPKSSGSVENVDDHSVKESVLGFWSNFFGEPSKEFPADRTSTLNMPLKVASLLGFGETHN